MLFILDANIFDFTAHPNELSALVIPVNTVGIAGKGLAKEFRNKYYDWFLDYQKDCNNKTLRIGKTTFYYCKLRDQYFINFPTKQHWNQSSKLEYIEQGLTDLVHGIQTFQIERIIIPALGCGLGDLNFKDVKPLIHNYLDPIKVFAYLIPPRG